MDSAFIRTSAENTSGHTFAQHDEECKVARAFVPALARVSQRWPARERDLCLITLASLQTGVNTHLTLNPSPSERDLCFFSTPGCLSKDASTIRPTLPPRHGQLLNAPQNNSASSSEGNLIEHDTQGRAISLSRGKNIEQDNPMNEAWRRNNECFVRKLQRPPQLARVFQRQPCVQARLVPY
jgi:hypothetical protein